MSKLTLTPVTSSAIEGYHYDPPSRALTVQFKGGGLYRYDDVSAEKVATMAENASPGAYFGANIKGLHPATKL